MSTMEDLESKKEESFVGALEVYESFLEMKMELEKKMKKGYMDLAQARYAMGVDRVGSLQYPPEMKATVRVCQGDDGFTLNAVEGGPAAKHLKTVSHADGNRCSQVTRDNDPLKWFGGMVSPSLRAAQASFSEVLPLVLQLVNASNRINGYVSAFETAGDSLPEGNKVAAVAANQEQIVGS